jgi:hypothetical protein
VFADSHNILNIWKNYYSRLLNVHWVSDFRQTEIYTAEPLVPEPSPSEVKIAIMKLNRHKSPGNYQILAELIQVCGKTFYSEIIKKLILYAMMKKCLRNRHSLLLYLFTKRVIKLTHAKFYIQHSPLKVNSIHICNYWRSSVQI